MAYYPSSYPTQQPPRDGAGRGDPYSGYSSGGRAPVTSQPGYYPTYPGPKSYDMDRERYNGHSKGPPVGYDNRGYDRGQDSRNGGYREEPRAYKPPKPMLPDALPAGLNGREWSSGKCDCTQDCSLCMCSLFCSPWYEMYRAHEFGEDACSFFVCCLPSTILALRHRMRDRENIKGSLLKDNCAMMFCGACVYCQLVRENDMVREQETTQRSAGAATHSQQAINRY